MKRKLDKRLRSIIGIMLTLGVFAFILLALNSWLGWPTSLLTLAGMLGIAWFVSMFAGEQITPPGLGTTAASCLALALAVSIIGFGVPWRLGEEDVRFDYRSPKWKNFEKREDQRNSRLRKKGDRNRGKIVIDLEE